ncbi:uracil/xanthine transporter [Clostridia bacterium]|nr:uracil/xanthine transporter [Clostridia bacterium]
MSKTSQKPRKSSGSGVIQVEERPPLGKAIPLSLQHMFAMFGASVLVPRLLGMDVAIVLLMNGIGTLLFILITKGKAPAYLGSSFAFLAPAGMVIASNGDKGHAYAQGGFVVVGLVFCLVALIIGRFGTKWINVVLPPAAMGPVVALIGLELAGTTVGSLLPDDLGVINGSAVTVFMVTLGVAILASVLLRGFLGAIPILIAIVVGYLMAVAAGVVDFSAVKDAEILALPQFQLPQFDGSSILIILPATLVVISEHIGHQLVTSKVVERDLIKDPGLHRSILGDGLSTALSGFVGSVPTTTYGENIGVMAITRVYSVWVIGGAAAISIVLSFIGHVSGFIQSIPNAVMGGISFLLYGMIAASGIRLMVESKIDYSKARNTILTSVVFITGLSGVYIQLGEVQLKGMALATIVGMVVSLAFALFEKLKLTNEK